MNKLGVLVIGTGMYVCGRGTDGYGTIMPAIFEWNKSNDIGEIIVAGKSINGVKAAKAKTVELQKKMGTCAAVRFIPEKRDDPLAYLKAIKEASKPACVIVATPDDLHKKVSEAAIRAGLHTLVVKPLVPTVKEARELIGLQKKNRLYCAVEFHKRYDSANLKLKDAVSRGAVGDPLYFLVEFSQRKSMPTKVFRRWAGSTNIFQYLGIHYVDMIYYVTKAKPLRAAATGQKNWLRAQGIDTYDAVEAVIEWEMPGRKRFVSHILTNWVDPETTSAISDQKIKVIGTRGRFESDQKDRGITIVTDEGGIEEPNPYFCSPFGTSGSVVYRGYGIESIHTFLRDVSDIEEGKVSVKDLEGRRPTFEDSIVPTKVLEAVNASLKNNGKWIRIN